MCAAVASGIGTRINLQRDKSRNDSAWLNSSQSTHSKRNAMLHMLRGTKTTLYLSDLMHRVGATAARHSTNRLGETVIVFTLPDGREKEQKLPRSALLNDDVNK
jgi:hypothetical protein